MKHSAAAKVNHKNLIKIFGSFICVLFVFNSSPAQAVGFDPKTGLASFDPNLPNIGNDARRKEGANGAMVTINKWVQDALVLADQIMTQAIPKFTQVALEQPTNTNAWTLDAMKRTHKRLDRLMKGDGKILWATDKQVEYAQCTYNSENYMLTSYKEKNMVICSRMINDSKVQLNDLAQTLIHESYHLVDNVTDTKDGYTRADHECQATYVEATSMGYSGAGLSFKNGYYDGCYHKENYASANTAATSRPNNRYNRRQSK